MSISRLLLAHGADVNATFRATKLTSLHFAVWKGNLELVSLMLEHIANPNAKALTMDDLNVTDAKLTCELILYYFMF